MVIAEALAGGDEVELDLGGTSLSLPVADDCGSSWGVIWIASPGASGFSASQPCRGSRGSHRPEGLDLVSRPRGPAPDLGRQEPG
jgi:hypothetical protein